MFKRATEYARTHDTLNADTDAAYWDGVTMDNIAEKDIPSAVSEILTHRTNNGYEDLPVKIFGYGQGSVETTLFLASANADSSGVDKAVLATPYYIYGDNGYITAGLISPPEPDRRLRNLE